MKWLKYSANPTQKTFFMVALTAAAVLGSGILLGCLCFSLRPDSLQDFIISSPIFLLYAAFILFTVIYLILFALWSVEHSNEILPPTCYVCGCRSIRGDFRTIFPTNPKDEALEEYTCDDCFVNKKVKEAK